jgi:hypothetical protein
MTIFSVLHKTVYRYKNPVRLGLHELLIRPRDSFDQRLLVLLWQIYLCRCFFADWSSAVRASLRSWLNDEIDDGLAYGR